MLTKLNKSNKRYNVNTLFEIVVLIKHNEMSRIRILDVVKEKNISYKIKCLDTKLSNVCKTVDDPSSYVAAQYKYWLPPKTQTGRIKVAKLSKTSSQHRILIYYSKE